MGLLQQILITIVAIALAALFYVIRHYFQITKRQRTELENINKELAKARDEALEATRAKSVFLANMSHELRTPMNAIIGYSEMLIEEAEEAEQERFISDLKKIHTAGRHLLQLINDILDLSKIEANKLELYLETFDVGVMIQDVSTTIQPLAEKNGNNLVIKSAPNLGLMRADLTRVRQILFNLLSNACKFTDHGTVSLETIREKRDGRDWFTISVRDSGIGMTTEQIGKLFQPFSQGDSSTTRKYGGTGLGLAITRRFCEMMGGDITVQSEIGNGSNFILELPAEVVEQKTEEPSTVRECTGQISGEACTILSIDDDPTIHDLLARFLNKEGFKVEVALSGEEGIRLAKGLHPQVILLDVLMPNMDGWATLSALKSDTDLTNIPVIMMTIVDDKNLGFTLGASDYICKPVDWNHLLAIVKKYCGKQVPGSALVVEDDAATREMLSRVLVKDGWHVEEAENGQVALKSVSQHCPDVILLDLIMPDVDGFEFLTKLRGREQWRSIPVIVVTGKDLTEQDRLRLNNNVIKIIKKGSFNRQGLLNELKEQIKTCLDRKN